MIRRVAQWSLLVFLLGMSRLLHAQPETPPSTDEQLAAQYYQTGEFDKALVYYEKLFNKKQIALYYNYYLNCMVQVQDFKKAEKVVKRQMRNNPYDLRFQVDLGRVYRASGDEAKAKKTFREAVEALQPNQEQVNDLAQAFLGINETELAVEAYQKGRKLMKGYYPFYFELAEVYSIRKEYQLMVNELMDDLGDNGMLHMKDVQNLLQTRFGSEADDQQNLILKNELLRRAQKNPDKPVYSELLLWMFMQQKDFEAAFVQAKALDKRQREEGSRVISLAETAAISTEFGLAVRCYDYVIGLGDRNYYYNQAQIARVNVLYREKTEHRICTPAEAEGLRAEAQKVITGIGKNNATAPVLKMLAHVEAFYLHHNDVSIAILEEAIELPQLSPTLRADLKLELGDVLLLDGQEWEASLRYSQVEKEFKHDVIGQEAKFRNARVFFYIGDFGFAQAQLDVLKGSTEKLISNDAMYLSLLITDNLALDSNPVPLMLFAKADLLSFQNKIEQAMLVLDTIITQNPEHTIVDDVLFKRYQVRMKQGRYADAAVYLKEITEKFGDDVLGDDSSFRLAELYDYYLDDKVKAKDYYEQVLTKYPGSMFVVDARKRFRALRGDKL